MIYLSRVQSYFRMLICNSVAGSNLCPKRIRRFLYNIFGNKIRTTSFQSHCFVGGCKLTILENSYIGHECFFDTTAPIVISENVDVAPRCSLITSTHSIGTQNRRASREPGQARAIYVGSGTWIGTNVVILAGVTIGKGCIIAAGTLVNKDCEDNTLYAGVPARAIRKLP